MGIAWTAWRCDPAEVESLVEDADRRYADEESTVYVDKAWHGIHWLLTGSEAPTQAVESEAIMGSQELNDAEEEGVALLLVTPERVAAVAKALESLTPEDLRRRMDPEAMEAAGLYPGIWDEEDVFDTYVGPHYNELRAFYAAAAASGQAVIQEIG